jgi:glycosyltransferase involved in cell wall biosynthesis
VKIVSVRPAWIKTSNRFTHLFSQAVQNSGWEVREFSWSSAGLLAPKVILLHWPDELFTAASVGDNAKILAKLALLNAAKRLRGGRLVWLVHETRPHDVGRSAHWGTRAFLKTLDGAIYLSQASRLVSEIDLPGLKRVPALVTRHGHYRLDMERPPRPRHAPASPLNLLYFGQVRPYKNLDGLIRAAHGLSPDQMRVRILGWSKDAAFTRSLIDLAEGAASVTLDIRDQLVPQDDLEAALDDSDGVVLPYRNILNSGAALFALSRNRPVLAPRLGTLPELQQEIGRDWVDLYDGDIETCSLLAFANRLGQSRSTIADLSRYEWDDIGAEIGDFLDQLTRQPRRAPIEPLPANRNASEPAAVRRSYAGGGKTWR